MCPRRVMSGVSALRRALGGKYSLASTRCLNRACRCSRCAFASPALVRSFLSCLLPSGIRRLSISSLCARLLGGSAGIIHGRRIRPPCGISDLIATWAAALAGIRSGGDRELQPQRRIRKAVCRVVQWVVCGCAAREARSHGAWAWRRDKPNFDTRANVCYKRSKRSCLGAA